MAELIDKIEPPRSRQRKRIALLTTHREEAFEILRAYRNSNTWDWWTLDDARNALCNNLPAGGKGITKRMVSDFLEHLGIADRITRKVIFASIEAARHCGEHHRLIDFQVAKGGREARSKILKARAEWEKLRGSARRTFYLGEFQLGLNPALGPWPRTIVSVTTGLACGMPGAKKATYYRLSRLGSLASSAFLPHWAGRGLATVLTNSRRFHCRIHPSTRNRVVYLKEANAILLWAAAKLGKSAVLPFSLDQRVTKFPPA